MASLTKVLKAVSPVALPPRAHLATAASKRLSVDSISKKVIQAEYAVRGELVIRAEQHAKVLASAKSQGHPNPLPFDEIIYCNIGNPQALLQPPVTFYRQVLSIVEYPELAKSEYAAKIYPKDVLERARAILDKIPGGIGAYSHSQGLPFVRQAIADFIQRRDGFASNPDDIFMYNGASPGIQHVLRLIIRDEKDGVLIPIPQYPLYSASIALFGGSQLGYYLDESKSWGLSLASLQQSIKEAKQKGITPRALVIINPGNPTGQVLDVANMKEIIALCKEEGILLMADEVYQENVYLSGKPWSSFKKVLKSMGPQYESVELFSYHSISKGFMGECGQRSGYMEVVGVDPEVKAQIYKLASILLCPNTAGQILMSLKVNPPKEGESSFPLYQKERDTILDSLKRRSVKLSGFFNTLEGVTCNPAEGAMYLFPQVRLPKKAVEAAKAQKKVPDTFYSLSMLDATGICVVPGSGFGQQDGTWHFRTTFLPRENQIDKVTEKMQKFHQEFMRKYKD